MQTSQIAYYQMPSSTSALDRHAAAVAGLGADPDRVGEIVRNVILQVAAAKRSGLDLPDDRLGELQTRSAARILDRVFAINPAPLTAPRRPEQRMIGNCHHAALLACALLRVAGVPARTRVGFAGYLDEPGRYGDHWICEILTCHGWQRFDPDVGLPVGDPKLVDFLPAGQAWLRCRAGDDPDRYGLEQWRGWWFIRNNVARDFAALCKVELLPWDRWGGMVPREEEFCADPFAPIDEIAQLTCDDDRWAERIRRFDHDDQLNPRNTLIHAHYEQEQLPTDW